MYTPRLCLVTQLFLLVIVHNMFSKQFQHAQITLQMDLKGEKIPRANDVRLSSTRAMKVGIMGGNL